MDKLKMQSADGVQDNIQKIAALFPNCVTETVVGYHNDGSSIIKHKVDFEKLQQELSDAVISGREERYQFTWPDKRKAILAANAPVNATLRPCREESVDFDTTQNLYIEGDNLDVLKCLKETYLHKVKMIYIDPPYNTGNDFVYEDDFRTESLEFRSKSGDYDGDGNLLVNRMVLNSESNGRFHTDWLNMIYPRLKVARDLLSEDGVIFISIDDNEVENLRKVCDEIFGEGNFVAIINWRRSGGRQDSKYYAVVHEYIICYAKDLSQFEAGEEIKAGEVFPKYDEERKRYYKTQLLRKWGSNSLRENRPNLYYPIVGPNGEQIYPIIYQESTESDLGFVKIQGCWRWGASNLAQAQKEGRIEFQKNKWNEWVPYEKIFAPLPGEENTKKYSTWIDDVNNGTDTIKKLFSKTIFDYSKSSELVLRFLRMANLNEDEICLDFFSGSATTAHAVMQLNAEDGGNRKFIMVQLPELTDEKSEAYKAGYKNICEIGKERIRRAGDRILELSLENLEKEGVIKKYARELSEVRSLEEVYGRSVISLLTGQETAHGGNIRPVGPDAEGGRVDTVEHSGGAVEGRQRVCAVSENSEGLAGRVGNTTVDMRTLELLNRRGYKIVLDSIGGNQQNDLFSDQASTNQNSELRTQNLELSSQNSALNSKLSVLNLDTGFRVLKLDSTNMEDIYYSPMDTDQRNLFNMVDNVKPDRTSEDLLFQVMLELGATLDSKIEVIGNEELGMRNDGQGYTIYNVADNYLVACFDQDVTDEVVTAIAKMQPMYAVLRDTSMKTDSTATNFEQIFKTYSPNCVCRII